MKKKLLLKKDHPIRSDSEDESTSKRIREHIANRNDSITADDIGNAKTDINHEEDKTNAGIKKDRHDD